MFTDSVNMEHMKNANVAFGWIVWIKSKFSRLVEMSIPHWDFYALNHLTMLKMFHVHRILNWHHKYAHCGWNSKKYQKEWIQLSENFEINKGSVCWLP